MKWSRCEKLPVPHVSLGEWTLKLLKFSTTVHAPAGLFKLTCGEGWMLALPEALIEQHGFKKKKKNQKLKVLSNPLKRVRHWIWDAFLKVHLLQAESLRVELDLECAILNVDHVNKCMFTVHSASTFLIFGISFSVSDYLLRKCIFADV